MTHTRSWSMVVGDPSDPRLVSLARTEMVRRMDRWMDRYGYAAVRVDWSTENATGDLMLYETVVIATVELQARWDGVWGDLRRALAEDGLLPDRDRPRPTAPLTDGLGTCYAWPTPPPDPGPGDIWFEPSTEVTRIFTTSGWCAVASIDPASTVSPVARSPDPETVGYPRPHGVF